MEELTVRKGTVFFTVSIRFVNHISPAVEPKDIISHTAGPARFHLMFVTEQPLSCHSSSIVQFSMGQHPKQCAFTSINITNYCNSD